MVNRESFSSNPYYWISASFKKLLPLLVLTVYLASCDSGTGSKKTVSKQNTYFVDIEKYIDNIKPIGLSDLGKSIEYIPLETSPDLVLGSISRITMYKSYLIFVSEGQIFLFDNKGHFLRRIGKKGRGPGEYQTASFCVDPYNDLICVASSPNILYFDFEGNLVGTYETGIFSMRFSFIEKDKILFSNIRAQGMSLTPDTVYNWIITDRFGKVVSQIDPVIRSGKSMPVFISTIIPLYAYDNRHFFSSLYSDSLFDFEDGLPKLYATFNLGKFKFDAATAGPADISSNNMDNTDIKSLIILDLLENDKYIFVLFNINRAKLQWSLFDKKTSEFFLVKDGAFQNDLDGGLGFWPEYIGEDGTMVGYADAITLLNHIEGMDPLEIPKSNKGEGLQLGDLKGVITEFSNPVIILLKR